MPDVGKSSLFVEDAILLSHARRGLVAPKSDDDARVGWIEIGGASGSARAGSMILRRCRRAGGAGRGAGAACGGLHRRNDRSLCARRASAVVRGEGGAGVRRARARARASWWGSVRPRLEIEGASRSASAFSAFRRQAGGRRRLRLQAVGGEGGQRRGRRGAEAARRGSRRTSKVKSALTAEPTKWDTRRICQPRLEVIALTSGRFEPLLSSSRQERPSGATSIIEIGFLSGHRDPQALIAGREDFDREGVDIAIGGRLGGAVGDEAAVQIGKELGAGESGLARGEGRAADEAGEESAGESHWSSSFFENGPGGAPRFRTRGSFVHHARFECALQARLARRGETGSAVKDCAIVTHPFSMARSCRADTRAARARIGSAQRRQTPKPWPSEAPLFRAAPRPASVRLWRIDRPGPATLSIKPRFASLPTSSPTN